MAVSEPRPFDFGGAKRPSGGGIARFLTTSTHAVREHAALPADHRAIVQARTLFPSTVVNAADAPRLLVSGVNSAKIGNRVRKGPWRGMPIYTLTLEERATCPRSCGLWRECYGNAMPLARRHRPDAETIPLLWDELGDHLDNAPQGIVVRLHVLGDFYSVEYAQAWARWMDKLPGLHVFGYSAHGLHSAIGRVIYGLNETHPDRWAIRRSVAPGGTARSMEATTIWRKPDTTVVPEGLICPAQTHKTAACATCGLCWAPAMRDTRIAFIGHGMSRRGAKGKA